MVQHAPPVCCMSPSHAPRLKAELHCCCQEAASDDDAEDEEEEEETQELVLESC